jgi:hypothetical protein
MLEPHRRTPNDRPSWGIAGHRTYLDHGLNDLQSANDHGLDQLRGGQGERALMVSMLDRLVA